MAIQFRKKRIPNNDTSETKEEVVDRSTVRTYSGDEKHKYSDVDEWSAFVAAKSILSSCDCGCDGNVKCCRNARIVRVYYSLRDFLIEKHMKFFKRVAFLASRQVNPFRRTVTMEDSISSAVLAGIQSVVRYDPGHNSNASFTTFAYRRIRGEIFDELRRVQDFSNCISELRRDIYPKIECLTHALGRTPTTEDLKDSLTDADFIKCMNPLMFSSVRMASDVFTDDAGLDGLVTSSQARRDYGLEKESAVNQIDLDLVIQNEKLRNVIFMYYYLGMTLNEIVLVEGVSIACVSKRKKEAEHIIMNYFGEKVNMVNFLYEK